MWWFIPAFISALASGTNSLVSKKAMENVSHYVSAWAMFTFAIPFGLLAVLITGVPEIGPYFIPAIIVDALLLVVAVTLYMKAISSTDLSLVLPMASFTPVFMLISGPLVLREMPSLVGLIGILGVVSGAYILSVRHIKYGLLAPFRALFKERGVPLMLVVAFLWAFSGVVAKLAVTQSSPAFAFFSDYTICALILTPALLLTGKLSGKTIKANWKILPLIGFLLFLTDLGLFYAFTLTLAVNAIAIKRLSVLIGSIYGFTFFKEKDIVWRLLGSIIMVAGAIVILLS
ncbi:MAG: DMT family transporter [Candidatus Diapherotrites archaeon]|nr:DMT family transporter [Candidatus Diapherotrites archaeon]